MASAELMQITHALLHPETALAAIEALRGRTETAVVEALVEHIGSASAARSVCSAIACLEACSGPLVIEGLRLGMASPHASVRLAAAQAARRQQPHRLREELVQLLAQDGARLVRTAALEGLAGIVGEDRWELLRGASDPHWRVRHALAKHLAAWGTSEAERRGIDARLADQGDGPRIRGLRAYLDYRWSGREPGEAAWKGEPEPLHAQPFWSWDGAVLQRNLERMGAEGRQQVRQSMPALLVHDDSRVAALALETLRLGRDPGPIAAALALLDEPRLGSGGPVGRLLGYLDLDRCEEVARLILGLASPSPAQLAWAVDQVDVSLAAEEVADRLAELERDVQEQPTSVRRALARLMGRRGGPERRNRLEHLLEDREPVVQAEAVRQLSVLPARRLVQLLASPAVEVRIEAIRAAARQGVRDCLEAAAADFDARIRQMAAEGLAAREEGDGTALLARLQEDVHPYVRAAALTRSAAERLLDEPGRETSWHVLGRAAQRMQVPFWRIEPDPAWRPLHSGVRAATALTFYPGRAARLGRLGAEGVEVARIGISGHYGLPVEGFMQAIENGVNLLFWEPNYHTLTEFARRLSPAQRNSLHFLAGSFEATGQRVQRDVEHALCTLQVECLTLFLVFWVQSWDRISDDVREALDRLKRAGKVRMASLSTHDRALAVEAIAGGWDPIMVRHSAAHRGAEETIFPRALERGTSLITFNNTCYGRLLKPQAGLPEPTAADCYRYTLSHPAVTMSLSAPATLEQLEENLMALKAPNLPKDRQERLVAQGERVYREDTVFRKLIRSR